MAPRHHRDRKNGRYVYDGDWNRVCARCGSTLATHDAESPHANDDATRGPPRYGFVVVTVHN